MRISDWSSDVCSSDLEGYQHRREVGADDGEVDGAEAAGHGAEQQRRDGEIEDEGVEALDRLFAHPALAADDIAAEHQAEDRQHGFKYGLHGQRDSGPRGRMAPRNGGWRDRKSTRLNSSH